METIRRLKGMCDRSPPQWATLHRVLEALRQHLGAAGYRAVEVPVLEETELFLRKSGGELASKMYTFTDPGGHRISLRPELTAPVVRAFVQGMESGTLPLRVQYAGPVFRYEPDAQAAYRQFTQVGVELLGVDSVAADAEVVALASQGLSSLGIRGFTLALGHLGVITTLLEGLRLSERARLFLLGSLGDLKQGGAGASLVRHRATELGLLDGDIADGALSSVVRRLSDQEAHSLVEGLLKEAVGGLVGQRTPQDVFHRYLRKLRGSDDPTQVEHALEFATALAAVQGPPEPTLEAARGVIREHHLSSSALEPLERLLELLGSYDLGDTQVSVDLGLARGIAYYTGLVFEFTHPALVGAPSLGGGGRYDGLVKALGGPRDVPALGFAYLVERILEVLDVSAMPQDTSGETVLVAPSSPRARQQAARLVDEIRRRGKGAELEVVERPAEESLAYAARRGTPAVITVDHHGKTTEHRVVPGRRRPAPGPAQRR